MQVQQLTEYDRQVVRLFGKEYRWEYNERGNLTLVKIEASGHFADLIPAPPSVVVKKAEEPADV